jgi:hypothetical protein
MSILETAKWETPELDFASLDTPVRVDRRSIGAVLSDTAATVFERLRYGYVPTGITSDDVAKLIQERDAILEARKSAHTHPENVHPDSQDLLMELLEIHLPHLSHDPLVRGYVLQEAGYMRD